MVNEVLQRYDDQERETLQNQRVEQFCPPALFVYYFFKNCGTIIAKYCGISHGENQGEDE